MKVVLYKMYKNEEESVKDRFLGFFSITILTISTFILVLKNVKFSSLNVSVHWRRSKILIPKKI